MQNPTQHNQDDDRHTPLKTGHKPMKPQSQQGGIVEPGQTDLDQGAGPKTVKPLGQ